MSTWATHGHSSRAMGLFEKYVVVVVIVVVVVDGFLG
jgi:hypothetical protein